MHLKLMISGADMIYSDLHCDTLTRCFEKGESLFDARGHINCFKIEQLTKYRQCFAVFTDDGKRGDTAFCYFKSLVEFYESEIKKIKNERLTAVLTAENGALLGGDSNNAYFMADKGVRMLTLTWNGENELASGALCDGGGLKPFGKEVIAKLETRGVYVDVSHLNEKSFYDVASFVKTPLIASHSNCFSLVPHRRNLKDEQIKLIIESGGLIGLCFHAPFLICDGLGSFEMLYRNIYRILSLGGENAVCFGSDFDGGVPESCLDSLHKVKNLYAYLKGRGLSEALLEKIFFSNAEKLFLQAS